MKMFELSTTVVLVFIIIVATYFVIYVYREEKRARKEEKEYWGKMTKELKERVESKSKKSPTIYASEAYEIEGLMEAFTRKKEEAKALIEINFPHPQITNDKFIQEIEKIDNDFINVYDCLQHFLIFYPVRDERGEKAIEKERNKLVTLYDRLVNILSELSMLCLQNSQYIDSNKIINEAKRDSEEISHYYNNYDITDDYKQITGTLKNSFASDNIETKDKKAKNMNQLSYTMKLLMK